MFLCPVFVVLVFWRLAGLRLRLFTPVAPHVSVAPRFVQSRVRYLPGGWDFTLLHRLLGRGCLHAKWLHIPFREEKERNGFLEKRNHFPPHEPLPLRVQRWPPGGDILRWEGCGRCWGRCPCSRSGLEPFFPVGVRQIEYIQVKIPTRFLPKQGGRSVEAHGTPRSQSRHGTIFKPVSVSIVLQWRQLYTYVSAFLDAVLSIPTVVINIVIRNS
jgi:hypothetical protein